MVGRELWAFLFMIGFLVFNWPFLEIFSDFLPYFLFGVWGVFITAVYLVIQVTERKGKKNV
ncbi:MAG: hypothetical protein EPN25_12385 [Nitrospirae bacterium]|nr:MAG: hypothetical protein EPN25_12385 [Nitrospirota bacterium]